MKGLGIMTAGSVVVLAGLLVSTNFAEGGASLTSETVRPVLTVTAKVTNSEIVGPFVGIIEARYETPLSFRISGRLLAKPVQRGDSVQKDQILATLESSIQQYQLQSAEASVSSAEAQLGNASDTQRRVQELFERGTASQAQLDAAVAARKSAEAQLNQARASLRQAQDQLAYTTLKAEFDGLVIAADGEAGQIVAAGETIITLARPDVREAVFQLQESEAKILDTAAEWKISIAGVPEDTTVGVLREVSPLISGSARSQTVRLSLGEAPEDFRLGTVVDISYARSTPKRIAIPRTALFGTNGTSSVWVVDPSDLTVHIRTVVLVSETDSTILIEDGLHDGDIVVVAGVHSLKEGQEVALSAEGNAK